MSYDTEGRYFTIEVMIKESPGHTLDDFWNIIEEWLPECRPDFCTCGLISMGGSSGTEEQCWKSLGFHESIAQVQTDDLKLVVDYINQCPSPPSAVWQAMKRLKKEAYWNEEYDEWVASLPEEEEEISHLEHYQVCNCLADAYICCREVCSTCKGEEDE